MHLKHCLSAEELYRPCVFQNEKNDFADIKKPEIFGQNSALQALKFGLEVGAHLGYNIFCSGAKGVGRRSLSLACVHEKARKQKTPDDLCCVANFDVSYRPDHLFLPAGQGQIFVKEMKRAVEQVRQLGKQIFMQDGYKAQLAQIQKEFQDKKECCFQELKDKISDKNVMLNRLQNGVVVAPVDKGVMLTPEVFNAMPVAKRKSVLEQMHKAQKKLENAVKKLPNWQEEEQEKIQTLKENTTRVLLDKSFKKLEQFFAVNKDVLKYIESVKKDIIGKIDPLFLTDEKDTNLWHRYEVNLLVSRTPSEGAPVVQLTQNNLSHLLGKIERIQKNGSLLTNHMLIRAGALHQANGGYLIIEAKDMLTNMPLWQALKNALFTRQIKMESVADENTIIGVISLDPAPVELSVKVILIGEEALYDRLMQTDDAFCELFKVHARFMEKGDRTKQSEYQFAKQLIYFSQKEKLRPCTKESLELLVEYASRLSGSQNQLTTFVGRVSDVLREADIYARMGGAKKIAPAHIQQALMAKKDRNDLAQKEMLKLVKNGVLKIETQGEKTGQLNALVVQENGDYVFGRPSKISCQVHVGIGDILDIERAVELGGTFHSKGVLILSAYLKAHYAEKTPLSLDASLVFEQSYCELDGDSASLAELYCLLSAIGEIPLKQGIAVTGSVNQLGQVQAVGGVNEKIEGYFTVCQMMGLTGMQGVIIPKVCQQNLMLSVQVRKAVKQNLFHIFAVDTVAEGLDVLCSVPFIKKDNKGNNKPDCVQGKIEKRLQEFYRLAKKAQLLGSK